MMHPDVQAQILLSFLDERRDQPRVGAAQAVASGRGWSRRALARGGDALIALGTLMKQRGQIELARPAVATLMEMN